MKEKGPVAGGAAGAPPSRVGMFAALRHRDYALFWSGALISNIGNWVQTTALFWYVKEYTHSDAWVGAVNLANYLPVLIFVLFSGYVADILDRRRLIMATQAVMMLSALALAICTSLGVAYLPVIMAIAAVAGIAFTFGFPPIQAILPDLVPREEMLNALALSSAQFNLGRVIGPAVGALVLAWWSVGAAYYINAFTFLFVIGAIWLARTRVEPSIVEHQHPLVHIKEGLHYVRQRQWMMAILAALGVASFCGFSSMVLFPALARDVLGRGSGAYGLLLTLTGLGAAAGAPLVTYLSRYLAEREIVKLGCLGLGLCLLGLSLSRTLWLSCVFSAGVGGSFLMLGSAVNTVLQARAGHDMRGRLVSIYTLMYLGTFPLGGQVLGWLADWRSTSFALGLGGAACVATAVVLIIFPALTRDAASCLGPETC
jgi:MFS family permease